jgi:hypothetical protein
MKIGKPTKDDAGLHGTLVGDSSDSFVNVFGMPSPDMFYHCPCCGYPTLATRGSFDVCAVCYWEDDGQDEHDADRVRGGPNASLSLTKATANFEEFGACDKDMIPNVRQPTEQEISHRKNDR